MSPESQLGLPAATSVHAAGTSEANVADVTVGAVAPGCLAGPEERFGQTRSQNGLEYDGPKAVRIAFDRRHS